MFNYQKSFFKYLKPSLLLTLALCSIPNVAKADDFRLQFGAGSNGFGVGVEQAQAYGRRDHERREHERRERARYFEQRYRN